MCRYDKNPKLNFIAKVKSLYSFFIIQDFFKSDIMQRGPNALAAHQSLDCERIVLSCNITPNFSAIGISGMIADNISAMVLILLFRLLLGVFIVGGCKTHVEACKVWFEEKFRLALGIVNGSYYIGGAFCSILGSYAYDHFRNFTIPFLLIGVGCCIILMVNYVVLPNEEISVLGIREVLKTIQEEDERKESILSKEGEMEANIYCQTRLDKDRLLWKEREVFSASNTPIFGSPMIRNARDRRFTLSRTDGDEIEQITERRGSLLSMKLSHIDSSILKGPNESTLSITTLIDLNGFEEKSYKEVTDSVTYACNDVALAKLKGVDESTLSLITTLEKGYDNTPEKEVEDRISTMKDDDDDTEGLALASVFPVLSTMFLDATYGYTASMVTPYLVEIFNISVSRAGFYVMGLNFSMTFGSIFSGYLMQKNVLSSSKIIILAASLGMVGLWVLFPGSSIPFLHESVPYTAFFALFLIGCSDQMGSMASFKAVEDIQVLVCRRSFGKKNRSMASAVFYTAASFAMAAGSAVTVIAIDALGFEQGSWLVIGGLFVSLTVGICTEIALQVSSRKKKTCAANLKI